MPTEEVRNAREKWLTAKKNYDDAVILLESIINLLNYQHAELDRTFAEFTVAQTRAVAGLRKAQNIKVVPKKKGD